MKNIKLLDAYLESEDAHCPKCNQVLFTGNGDKCSHCGESIELTIKVKPRISYSWQKGVLYGGVPVGLVFILGFCLGISILIGILKFVEIL